VTVITSVVYTTPSVGVGWEVELLLTGYGALDELPGLSEKLAETPVGRAKIGAEPPVPILLVNDVVLCVTLLLGRVNGAEPVGMSGGVGPGVVVEFHNPVPLVCDGTDREADAKVGMSVLPVDDEVDEAEVLDWLDEVDVVDVTEEEPELLDEVDVVDVTEEEPELLDEVDVVDVTEEEPELLDEIDVVAVAEEEAEVLDDVDIEDETEDEEVGLGKADVIDV